jgi:signal transduction histidine kinase
MVSDLGESAVNGVELKAGDSDVEIQLGAVDLSGERVKFQYRLGDTANWSEPFDGPSLMLAGPAPGHYRLSVRAIGASTGVTSQSAAVLEFRSIPALWRRWWFQLLLVALCIAAAVRLHRFRVARLVELERVRTRIAADLHDDIGASLSQVAILSEIVHRRSNDSATVERYTERIASVSREVVDSMSDIVWAVNPRNDSLSALVQRMRDFASEILTSKGIELRFEASGVAAESVAGTELRRQMFLIFKEAVNNAARHSGSTKVNIRLSVDGSWLTLVVGDDGRGFEPGSGSGNGLNNIRRRVEALRGTFDAGPNDSGGARLRVRTPLH